MNRPGTTIDFQMLCTWLGLPAGCWPPDHYTLLGLPPCETDVERIEQRVHERLIRLRSYQLSHPALATEAMTRLAKAFDCLTDPQRKHTYDAMHWPGKAPAVPSARVPTVIASDTVETTPVPDKPPAPAAPAWWTEPSPPPVRAAIAEPPPVRAGTAEAPPLAIPMNPAPPSEPPPVRIAVTPAQGIPVAIVEPPPVQVSPAPAQGMPLEPPPVRVAPTPANGILVAAPAGPPPTAPKLSDSSAARRLYLTAGAVQEVGSRRDLYERMLWFRRALRAWNRAGKYLAKPRRQLTKSAEDAELARLLLALDDVVQDGPPLLGQPGQPGYRILALAGEEPIAARFKALDEGQRDAVAKDWTAVRTLLSEYRECLKRHVKKHRRLTRWQRLRHSLDGFAHAYGLWVLLTLGVAGVLVLVAAWLH